MTLESVLALMVYVIVLVASIQFTIALIVKHAVSHAATVAAREAGKGADLMELVEVVETVLEPHALLVGSSMSVLFEDGLNAPQQAGTLACSPPAGVSMNSDEVRVSICAQMNVSPFVNWLSTFGIDMSGSTFRYSSLVKQEQ